jgi:hypothetical protein
MDKGVQTGLRGWSLNRTLEVKFVMGKGANKGPRGGAAQRSAANAKQINDVRSLRVASFERVEVICTTLFFTWQWPVQSKEAEARGLGPVSLIHLPTGVHVC